MSVKILIEAGVGETRAVAYDAGGRPFSLYVDRWAERGKRALFGNSYPAVLRRHAPKQGGGYAELETGEEVFLRSQAIEGLAEGARLIVKVEAEARRGKLARASVAAKRLPELNGFERWRATLKGGDHANIKERRPGDADIAAAFDEAAQESVILPGGGTLHLIETPALVAIDIDTSGRDDAGRAHKRAERINSEAAQEAARQLCLLNLGGLAVLDCVAPLRKEGGSQIKRAFLDAFRAFTTRRVEVLKPSPFGLMEISMAWQFRPVSHALLDDSGAPNTLSKILEELRNVERWLIEDRKGTYLFCIPQQAQSVFSAELEAYEKELAMRYGARAQFAISERERWEVRKK